MPGTAAGTVRRKQRTRGLGHLLDARLPGTLAAGDDHVRLEEHALEDDPLGVERGEDGVERGLGDLDAALDGVVAVHEHLGLDDRDEARLLAERGVASESVGVGVDAVRGRDARTRS